MWLGSIVAYVTIGSVVIAALRAPGADDAEISLGVQLLAQLPMWVGFVGGSVLVVRLRGADVVRSLRLAVRPLDVPIGLAVGVATQALLVPAIYFPFSRLVDTDRVDDAAREIVDRSAGTRGLVLVVLLAVICAPIAEEILFRGLALGSLERSFGTATGVIASAAAFALSHLQLLQLPALFVVGVVLALLVVRTGRLAPSIVAHMAFNATAVFALR